MSLSPGPRYLAGIITLSFTLLLSCSKQLPENLEVSLQKAILNVDPVAITNFDSLKLTELQLDSLAQIIRSKPKQAIHIATDSYGSWTLGVDTNSILKSKEKQALIVYLHGGIGTTRTDKGSKAYEMLQFLNRDNTTPYLLMSPSANRNAPWWSKQGIDRIIYAVKYAELHYNIDPTRIYLCGVSDGGTGVFAVASTENHPFAAFIAISGFGGMLPRLGRELNIQNLKRVPIYQINAGKDRLYPLPYVQAFASELKQKGVPIQESYHPDEEHGFAYKEKERCTILTFLQTTIRKERHNHLYYREIGEE